MLLCDGCDDAYHMFCLDPPLKSIPEGDWYANTRNPQPATLNHTLSSLISNAGPLPGFVPSARSYRPCAARYVTAPSTRRK
jgi:hypothetical protein